MMYRPGFRTRCLGVYESQRALLEHFLVVDLPLPADVPEPAVFEHFRDDNSGWEALFLPLEALEEVLVGEGVLDLDGDGGGLADVEFVVVELGLVEERVLK